MRRLAIQPRIFPLEHLVGRIVSFNRHAAAGGLGVAHQVGDLCRPEFGLFLSVRFGCRVSHPRCVLPEFVTYGGFAGTATEAVCHQPAGKLEEPFRRDRVVLALLAVRLLVATADVLEIPVLLVAVHQGTAALAEAVHASGQRILDERPRLRLANLRVCAVGKHFLYPVPPFRLDERLISRRCRHVFSGLVVDQPQELVAFGVDHDITVVDIPRAVGRPPLVRARRLPAVSLQPDDDWVTQQLHHRLGVPCRAHRHIDAVPLPL